MFATGMSLLRNPLSHRNRTFTVNKIIFAALLSLTISTVALSQTDTRTVADDEMDRILVTAKRRSGLAFDTPFTTHSFDTLRTLLENAPRSVPSLLENTPGVMGQKTAFGQESPFVRGFTGFRTLLMVDGVRINNSAFREGPNQYWGLVDPLSLQRVELVKGPAGALYGSDAIGGAANALTRDPAFTEARDWDGRAYYRLSSAEESHTARGELSTYQREKFGVIGGVSYKNYGDLRAGGSTGRLTGTGFDELDGDLKFVVFPREHVTLTLLYQHVEQHAVPRWHSTVNSKSFAGTTLGTDLRRDTDQTRDFTYLRAEFTDLNGFAERMQFTVSYQNHRETEDRIPANTRQQLQNFEVQTLGVSALFESPTEKLGVWTYGADFYRDWVNSSASRQLVNGGPLVEQPRGPIADDATYDLFGVFAQNELKLGEKVEVILGGRYTFARLDANKVLTTIPANFAPIEDEWHAFTGSGRVLFRAHERLNVFAGVSQGFRAPNLSDLTRLDAARTGELETPSPGLTPEHFVSFELGAKTRGEKFSGQVAYFYTLIDGMIVRYPTGVLIGGLAEVTKANSGNGFVHGVELSGERKLIHGFSVFGDLTWMEGRLDAPTAPGVSMKTALSRVQPLTGHFGVRWRDDRNRWWAETSARFAAKADKLAPSDVLDTQRIPPGGTPGYGVWHVRGGCRVNENVSVFGGVENVLDKDYRVHGSGINEAGRNFVVGGEVKF